MRTTLNLDDNVVASLKSLAAQRDVSVGEIASELLKKALTPPKSKVKMRNGIRLFTPRPGFTGRITPEFVKQLMEEDE